jgi:hypothetical protein
MHDTFVKNELQNYFQRLEMCESWSAQCYDTYKCYDTRAIRLPVQSAA